jgi:hypothetical protein
MEQLFACPPSATLTTIPAHDCAERFDQIIRFLFQLKQDDAPFTATSVLLAATWAPFMAASDETKIVGTPIFGGLTIPKGGFIKTGGGDNSTPNGIPVLGGRQNVSLTPELKDIKKAVRAAVRALAQHSALAPGFTNLTFFPVNRYGQIIAAQEGTDVFGIDVYNVLLGDTGSEGLGAANANDMNMDLAAGWSDNVVMFKPTDFNPINL